MTLVLNLTPELEQRLTQEATRQGLTTADLALQFLEERLVPSDADFNRAKEHVLKKNAELYCRLRESITEDVCERRRDALEALAKGEIVK